MRDAVGARAEDRMYATEAFQRAAARTRFAFITRHREVVEVVTTRSLHEIAAVGCGIPQLRARASQNRLRNERITFTNEPVISSVAILRECAESQAAFAFGDLFEFEAIDIDKPSRAARRSLSSSRSGWCHRR